MSIRAAEGLRHRLAVKWQISEIKAAIKEADAGEFASEEEVEAVTRKWKAGAD